MRSITDVTKRIIDKIPNDHIEIKEDLTHIFNSIQWAPPEKIKSTHYWNMLSDVLTRYITMEDYNNKQWCKMVIDIFREPTSVTDLDL